MRQPWTCAKCDQPILKGQPFTTAIVPGGCPTQASSSRERSWFTRTKRTAKSARRGSVEDAVELDGDHAFGDCGSRRPVKAASKNPCHMRGNSSTEAGRGTSGCYVERPARVNSTSLARLPPVEQACEPLGRHERCFASWARRCRVTGVESGQAESAQTTARASCYALSCYALYRSGARQKVEISAAIPMTTRPMARRSLSPARSP